MAAVRLQNLPQDVFEIVLKKQMQLKKEKNRGQFSQEQTVYAIIREWSKLYSDKPILFGGLKN